MIEYFVHGQRYLLSEGRPFLQLHLQLQKLPVNSDIIIFHTDNFFSRNTIFFRSICPRFFWGIVVILYAKIFQEGFSPAYYDKVYAL